MHRLGLIERLQKHAHELATFKETSWYAVLETLKDACDQIEAKAEREAALTELLSAAVDDYATSIGMPIGKPQHWAVRARAALSAGRPQPAKGSE